jgi:hypothetical protein
MNEISEKFLKIKTLDDLADILKCKLNTLLYYCKYRQSSKCYTSFLLKKKSGGERLIVAPNKQLKYIQKRLSDILYDIYSPKKIATGFIKNKSVATNALVHSNKRMVLNIDIENFFDSIHFGRVFGVFKKPPFNFSYDIALAIAQLVCCNGQLPQGAPTSPIISNLVCRTLDNDLAGVSRKYKILCTRYCDDITFSTKAKDFPQSIAYFSNDNLVIGEELNQIFEKNKFKLNYSKIRLKNSHSRQMVTGIVVNEKPNILNWKYRKFRTILHYTYCNGLKKGAERNGYISEGQPDEDAFNRYLVGTINYYKMVMTAYSSKYQALAKKYNEFIGRELFSIPDSFETDILNYVFIIEDLKENYRGTAFLVKGIGLVTCLHNIFGLKFNIERGDLENKIKNEVKVFLPSNENRTYLLSLQEFFFMEDLLVLNINIPKDRGYEIEKYDFNIGEGGFTSVGYPNYHTGNSADILQDIKIRAREYNFEQELYSVDKTLIVGASGGPVFNKDLKVVGYIDRGNECPGNPQAVSAICSIKPLLNLINN